MKIVFVCTGNTCRSAMAKALFDDIMKKSGIENTESESCGLAATDGDSASKNAVLALSEIGVDIHTHQAKRATIELLNSADIICAMTPSHKNYITGALPHLEDKILVANVTDPYMQDLEVYKKCRDDLIAFIHDEIIPKIQKV